MDSQMRKNIVSLFYTRNTLNFGEYKVSIIYHDMLIFLISSLMNIFAPPLQRKLFY